MGLLQGIIMIKRFVFILLGGLLLSTPAHAVSIDVFNTGVDAGGVVVPNGTVGDMHYTLTSVPVGETDEIKAVTQASGYPTGVYVGDNGLSRWIGPNNPQLQGLEGDYVYSTTFMLTAVDVASAVLEGIWTTDNAASIWFNGYFTGNTTEDEGYGGFVEFSITDYFQLGLNTIEFIVHNGVSGQANAGPTALRVQFLTSSVDEINAVPVPAALPLFGTGLALMGFLSWRRKRKAA